MDTEEINYVSSLSDEEAVKLLVESKKYAEPEAKVLVASWRKYASDRDYTGPVAWKVEAGFTFLLHAEKAGPCYFSLDYQRKFGQESDVDIDEPTKDSLVFWVPRLAPGSIGKTPAEMEGLYDVFQIKYSLPFQSPISFGSISLLFALIFAHFKRIGEKVPLDEMYAVSDTYSDNGHLIIGNFVKKGLACNFLNHKIQDSVGFFLLTVVELGEDLITSDADDVLADKIIASMNELFKDKSPIVIEPASMDGKNGFQVETDMGSSFAFPIWRETRLEVATAYYNRAVSRYEYMVNWRRTIRRFIWSVLAGGYWLTKKEKLEVKDTYERLKAWGAEHLPPKA